ncbi:MAG: SNF2-related protein, partial [Bacteroidia bacterium]
IRDRFNNLWNNDKTYTDKTILNKNGKEVKQNFKEYLIHEIARLFEAYNPEQIYYKILFELFNTNDNDAEVEKQLGRLDDTVVYKQLYDFQKGAVRSLITMLAKHNGAILADAVGLGKTWTALAVIKAYQMQGTEIVVFCPKKLEQNWTQYLKKNNSLFEDDKLDYEIKFHTDLREGGLHTNKLNEDYFTSDKPKLFVIDESHNLRNEKSIKYTYLVEQILQKSKGEIKILLLSATPINNSFKDIRNQFKLMVKGQNDGFKDTLAVNNVDATFRQMQGTFNKWSAVPNATLASFHEQIKDSDFFKLTDALLVARTRKNIKANYDSSLTFPIHSVPINIFKTPLRFGDVENFAELMDNMKLNLSAYLPSTYLLLKQERDNKKQKRDVLKDEQQREHFLVKMMMILMLKRLESSWYAFDSTVTKILQHHTNLITLIDKYQDRNEDAELVIDVVDEEDAIEDLDEENKQKIALSNDRGNRKESDSKKTNDEKKAHAVAEAAKFESINIEYALDTCKEIVEKCNLEIQLGKWLFPEFTVESGRTA